MRRWQILTMSGLLGVASLWLVPFHLLLPEVQLSSGTRLLALIQPAILTVVAILAGQYLAPKVGLGAPLIDALLRGEPVGKAVLRVLPYASLVGLASALILITYTWAAVPTIARTSAEGARLASFEMPLLTKLLYGGITEELLTRWGLVSLFAWLGWRISGRPEVPAERTYWIAIAAAALLFGLGHLPLLMLISPDPQPWLAAAVLAGNAIPGVLFGWLYWRKGIEAAILAHMLAHLISSAFT